MTGYGRGEATRGPVTVVVELKSVNNRFRDVQIRCPREYLALESRIGRLLKDPFPRGRIDAFVHRGSTASKQRVVADSALANEYMRVINEIAEEGVGFVSRDVPFTFILSQVGVLQVMEAEVDALAEWDIVETAVLVAVADLQAMRVAEGGALERELSQQLQELLQLLQEVEEASEGVNERLRLRLEARLKRLIGDRVDAWRLAQEVAILAEKADVSEEVARLRSHCNQFGDALAQDEAVGRRLDFLLQEMNREVNTIGSKAIEHAVSQRVVDMKSVLEKMREQAANVQ